MTTNGKSWSRVEAGLYRRKIEGKKVGSYFAMYSTRGQAVQESLQTSNLLEARRLLRIRKVKDGLIDPKTRGMTLAAATDKWHHTRANLQRSTIKNDALFVRRIKEEWPSGPGTLVRLIKPSDVLTFLNNIQSLPDPKGQRRPVSNSYRNHLGWTLRAILALCVNDGVIDVNPASAFAGQGDREIVRNVPTREQFDQIVQSIRSGQRSDTAQAAADLVEFMGKAGVGNAECAELRWADVDFPRNQIHLLRQKTGRAFSIKIYPQVKSLLERMKAAAGVVDPLEKVFLIKDPKKSLQRACKDLNLLQYTPRNFRQMFITEALEAGIDPGIVARTQGHRDGGVLILRTYRHIRPKFEDEQLERLR